VQFVGERTPTSHASVEILDLRDAESGIPDDPAGRHADGDVDRRPAAARDEGRDIRIEREVIVHRYLKEVRDWVAASPALDDGTPGRQQDAGQPRDHGAVVGLEEGRRTLSPARPTPSAPLNVEDVSLSIGTISVVIEEPPSSPAVQRPPALAPPSPERAVSEPTRLSRYYLRRW
jgi:hypothetical protein